MKEGHFSLAQAFTPGSQGAADLFPARFSGLSEGLWHRGTPRAEAERRQAVKTAWRINLAAHPGLKAGAREKGNGRSCSLEAPGPVRFGERP